MTYQQIVQAIEKHHAATLLLQVGEKPEPMKSEIGQAMIDSLRMSIHDAFIAGVVAQHDNPWKPE